MHNSVRIENVKYLASPPQKYRKGNRKELSLPENI